MNEPVDWIKPPEVKRRTGRNIYTVYRALESGELHGHQRVRGGRWQIHPAAVTAWVQGLDGVTVCGCERLKLAKRTA